MKKLLIVMLSVVACVCLCLFAACGDEADGEKTNGSESVAVESVTLNKSELTLTVGDDETLTATVSPDNATDKTVTWESSNTSVATVTGGKVTAVAAGEATITAKAGDKSATCSVTVNAAVKSNPTNESEWRAYFMSIKNVESYTVNAEISDTSAEGVRISSIVTNYDTVNKCIHYQDSGNYYEDHNTFQSYQRYDYDTLTLIVYSSTDGGDWEVSSGMFHNAKNLAYSLSDATFTDGLEYSYSCFTFNGVDTYTGTIKYIIEDGGIVLGDYVIDLYTGVFKYDYDGQDFTESNYVIVFENGAIKSMEISYSYIEISYSNDDYNEVIHYESIKYKLSWNNTTVTLPDNLLAMAVPEPEYWDSEGGDPWSGYEPDEEYDPARAEWEEYWENLANSQSWTMEETLMAVDGTDLTVTKYDSENNRIYLSWNGSLSYIDFDFENATKTEYNRWIDEETGEENWSVWHWSMFGEEDTREFFNSYNKMLFVRYQMMMYYDVLTFDEETNTYYGSMGGTTVKVVFENGNVKSIEITENFDDGYSYSYSYKYEISGINSTEVTIPQAALDVPKDEVTECYASKYFWSENYTGTLDAGWFVVELYVNGDYRLEIGTDDENGTPMSQYGTYTVGEEGALTFTVDEFYLNGEPQTDSIQLDGVWADINEYPTLTISYNGQSSDINFAW